MKNNPKKSFSPPQNQLSGNLGKFNFAGNKIKNSKIIQLYSKFAPKYPSNSNLIY